MRDFREYLRLAVDIDQLSHTLSRIEGLRFNSPEFNLVFYLHTASRRAIRMFLRLREEVVRSCCFSPEQYLPVSTHNSAKYAQKYAYLDSIQLGRKQWERLVNLAGFEYDDELAFLLMGGNQ